MAKLTYSDKVSIVSNANPRINKATAEDFNEIKASVNALYDALPAGVTEYIIVDNLDDLPSSVGGVITLSANTAYFFVKPIDLLGDRIVGGSNTCLLGTSSETAIISSTGLGAGIALFSTENTTPIRNIAFKDVDTALNIQGAANSAAFDWLGFNLVNIPNLGVIDGGNNFIMINCAFINSKGLVFTGAWNTIGFDSCLFSGDGDAGNILELDSACVVNRRFRTIYSAVVAFGSTVGFDVDVSATLPIEGYILDTVSFSGGGTYLNGLSSDSVYSNFLNCTGVTNSYLLSNYFMNGNATQTIIGSVGVAVKVLGSTTSNSLSQKFVNTDNRATYVGGNSRIFKVTSTLSVESTSANDQVGVYIAKNGSLIDSSEAYLTTNSQRRAENISVQAVVELTANDYIEVYIENSSDTSSLTVADMNLIVVEVK